MAIYEHFFSSRSGQSNASYRMEKYTDITVTTICLAATIIEWQLDSYKTGDYLKPPHLTEETAGGV